MKYIVVHPEGIRNNEFDIFLPEGTEFEAGPDLSKGQIEPDLVAEWLSKGLIESDKPINLKPLEAEESAEVEE